jgi:hypothetical protein
MLLGRNHEHIDIGTPKILFTWAVIFACVSILACPTLVQDFWLSLAWGRMVGEGINPYHSNVTPEILQGLPLTEVSIRMTYGPLWALISGVVMLCTGGHWLLGALIFKLLLGGAWVGCLWLTWVLLRQHSPWHQCVGIAVFGWLPLSVIQTVADGHNDVFMVFFLLLWLYFLDKGRPVWASLSLTASALVKYITAPLFLLDILHLRYSRKQKLSAYIPQLAAAAALSLIVFGVFYRSPDFFDSTTEMRNWLFFRPSDAVTAIERLTGIKIWYGARLVRALFPIFAIYFIIAYVRKPQRDNFVKAILATVSAVLFSAVGHVWPWFVLWAVAVAGLVPGSALARWVLGVGLAAPFPLLVWVVFPDASDRMKFDVPALVLYTFTLLWFVFVPKSWFPKYAEFKTSQAAQYNGSGAA